MDGGDGKLIVDISDQAKKSAQSDHCNILIFGPQKFNGSEGTHILDFQSNGE